MSWIERILNKSNITQTRKASIPEGVWTKCDSCGQVLYRAELERNLEVCPKCDHHMRMGARARLHTLLDEGSEVELGSDLEPKDVLKFKDSKRYKDRLVAAQKATGEKDALVVMKGTLYGMPIVAASFERREPRGCIWLPWTIPIILVYRGRRWGRCFCPTIKRRHA